MPRNPNGMLCDDNDPNSIDIDTFSRRGKWGISGIRLAIVGGALLFTGSLCSAQDYTTPLDIEYNLVDVTGMAVRQSVSC